MRLFRLRLGFCLAAHFALVFAVFLLFSSNTFAQHSSGGGGSSGGSASSGGGGGSHGGSSGGSSSSGGHSSGGSSSHGSSATAGGHGASSGSHSPRSGPSHSSPASGAHSVREPNTAVRGKTGTEKRGFFSLLRHPFRKPQPKPEPAAKLAADLRRPICFRGPCTVCPTGLGRGGGGCGGAVVANNYGHRGCAAGEGWNGIACLEQNHFPYDCGSQRTAMEQQAQRMHAAESAQQRACSTGSKQDCSDLTSTSQNEASLYRNLQAQYRSCQQRGRTVTPFGHSAGAGYSQGLSFDPF
jgi:hypothetical protein